MATRTFAAIAISIAIIVSSDVRGRAIGAVAQYGAREQIAATFLSLSRPAASVNGQQSASAVPEGTRVKLDPGGQLLIQGALGGQLQAKFGNDLIETSRIEVVSSKA